MGHLPDAYWLHPCPQGVSVATNVSARERQRTFGSFLPNTEYMLSQ